MSKMLLAEFDRLKMDLDPYNWEIITGWKNTVNKYKEPVYTFKVRDKEIKVETHTESLSHTQIPKIALPKYEAWGDILRWCLQENVPGNFLIPPGCILSNGQVKTLPECSQEKADRNAPTAGSIM